MGTTSGGDMAAVISSPITSPSTTLSATEQDQPHHGADVLLSSLQSSNLSAVAIPEMTTSNRCRLLKLPRELRDNIYAYVLSGDITINLPKSSREILVTPGLPRTCRQIREECSQTFYELDTVHVNYNILQLWQSAMEACAVEADSSAREALSALRRSTKLESADQKQPKVSIVLHIGRLMPRYPRYWEECSGFLFKASFFCATRRQNTRVVFDYRLENGTLAQFNLDWSSETRLDASFRTATLKDGSDAILSVGDLSRLQWAKVGAVRRIESATGSYNIWDRALGRS